MNTVVVRCLRTLVVGVNVMVVSGVLFAQWNDRIGPTISLLN